MVEISKNKEEQRRRTQLTHVLVHSHRLYLYYVIIDYAMLLKYFVHNEDVTVKQIKEYP